MNYEDKYILLDTLERDFRFEVAGLSSSLLRDKSANIEVFNLANKGSPEKIYQFDEVIGGRFTTSNYPNRFFLLLLTNSTLILKITILSCNSYGTR